MNYSEEAVITGSIFALGIHLYDLHHSWMEYILTGVGVFFTLATIAILTKGSAIGGGDIKLLAMIGFALGVEAFFLVFVISHIAAAIFLLALKLIRSDSVRRDSEFPFAPFILFSTLLTYVYYWVGLGF